ncbi:MAG: serine/threonine-protein kinase [Deltaproteobacteria bacterium]|nr:serine/threonine-protein kinase [Deltaproteobacteria bacterium]
MSDSPVSDDTIPDSEGSLLDVAADTELPTVPGSVRSVRKGKLREALFGASAQSDRFGRYELRGMLGRGGMGTVLEAHDATLGRTIALKLLHADMAEQHGERLLREARALAKLSHPNVVHVHEAGQQDGRAFIAMELVRGQTLKQWQQRRRPWRECVEAYLQAGRGIAAAHAQGLVHRDFKPSNCMIDEQGRVRVLDFGLVRDLHVPESAGSRQYPPSVRDTMLAQTLTRTGAVLGTLVYMAPEQLCGRGVDAKSDQFSFCAALHEALYGVRPFTGSSIGELLSNLMSGKVPPAPRGVRVPSRIRRIVVRGLSLTPEDRWPSMSALLRELARPIRPSQWLIRGGLVLAVGAPVVAWSWHRSVVDALSQCRQQRTQFERAWGPARKDRVRDVIVGHPHSHAQHTWWQVHHRLDDYANRWGHRLEQTCEALVDAEDVDAGRLERRLSCLRHRWWSFESTVEVLGRADAAVVSHAVEMVSGLPTLHGCDDDDALAAMRMRSTPRDAERMRQGDTLWHALARSRALARAGHDDQAEALLAPLVEQAQALQMGPALAEVLLARGHQHRQQGRLSEAESTLVRAHAVAVDHGYDVVAVGAAAALVELIGRAGGRAEEARDWERQARAQIERGHAGAMAQALLSTSLGAVSAHHGKLDEARTHYTDALHGAERAHRGGPVHPDVADAHVRLAEVLVSQGEFDDAVHHYYHALVRREVLLGEQHPALRAALVQMARVELRRDHPAAARSLARRAVELGGPDDRAADPYSVAVAQLVLAMAMWPESADRSKARALGQQARQGLQQHAASDDPVLDEAQRWLALHTQP